MQDSKPPQGLPHQALWRPSARPSPCWLQWALSPAARPPSRVRGATSRVIAAWQPGDSRTKRVNKAAAHSKGVSSLRRYGSSDLGGCAACPAWHASLAKLVGFCGVLASRGMHPWQAGWTNSGGEGPHCGLLRWVQARGESMGPCRAVLGHTARGGVSAVRCGMSPASHSAAHGSHRLCLGWPSACMRRGAARDGKTPYTLYPSTHRGCTYGRAARWPAGCSLESSWWRGGGPRASAPAGAGGCCAARGGAGAPG
jgi:hypothetical protein